MIDLKHLNFYYYNKQTYLRYFIRLHVFNVLSNMSDPAGDKSSSSGLSRSAEDGVQNETENQSNLVQSTKLSGSASSLNSVASSKASVSTTKSGIRPPSRIGRPCGDRHKPPVPQSPPKSSEYNFVIFVERYILNRLLESDYTYSTFISRKG
ncbi:hypothetical protein GWI33_009082 [Rhynchophorus ferrugineus]|uniref:Uncharacterized protein n=1 Tax=Rhynchophorus ferrugineus TaxID=354439 RepID=A0A834IG09_RHYFE|nr:hypothetical protein GWI33_009082 [Rhynchophorus ferrugineus]